ncbi:hypothetical protein BCV72DRAFT_181598, partial [Rhizopus microsporus var. microsporus]
PTKPISSPVQQDLYIGQRVAVDSMGIVGTLKFLGEAEFKEGYWAGIQLDILGSGKNDGSVKGTSESQEQLDHLFGESIRQAPNEAVMKLHQLQLRVEVLEAENRLLKPDDSQPKTDTKIMELETEQMNLMTERDKTETHLVQEYQERVRSLNETIDELKRAGLESIELYESSVEMNRVDREALNASLADERRKVALLEAERAELHNAGREAIQTYEATIAEIKKERESLIQEQNAKREALEATIQKKENEHKRQIASLNRDISELEGLIESKVFKEADLEEALDKERKTIKKLQMELQDLK